MKKKKPVVHAIKITTKSVEEFLKVFSCFPERFLFNFIPIFVLFLLPFHYSTIKNDKDGKN